MQVSIQERNKIIQDFNNKVKPYFYGLTFKEKSHEYFINDKKIPVSVSGLVKGFVPVQDWDAIANRVAKKEGVSKQEIVDRWREKNRIACDNGTKTHDFAENLSSSSSPSTPKEVGVVRFWKYLDTKEPGRYILVAKELRMYHKIFNFSGTGDFILYDTLTRQFIIGDYKTNEDLFKNYNGQLLLEPFDFLLDCPYNHYQIQLSLYQLLFEQLDYRIYNRWIVYLQVDSNYKVYECYNYSDHLRSFLVESRKVMTKEISMNL